MKREKTLLFVGIATVVVPNLGFSSFTEKIIFAVFGITLVIIAYAVYFERHKPAKKRAAPKRESEVAAPSAKPVSDEVNGFTFVKRESDNDIS